MYGTRFAAPRPLSSGPLLTLKYAPTNGAKLEPVGVLEHPLASLLAATCSGAPRLVRLVRFRVFSAERNFGHARHYAPPIERARWSSVHHRVGGEECGRNRYQSERGSQLQRLSGNGVRAGPVDVPSDRPSGP
jgi:hypothetical protein